MDSGANCEQLLVTAESIHTVPIILLQVKFYFKKGGLIYNYRKGSVRQDQGRWMHKPYYIVTPWCTCTKQV